MVLCKDFQPQGIRELWDLVKSSHLVRGVTGRDGSRGIAFVKIWRAGRCKLEKRFQKFCPGTAITWMQRGNPGPLREGTELWPHSTFLQLRLLPAETVLFLEAKKKNLCFKITSHFIMVGYEKILIYKMTLKYWEQKLWVFGFFLLSAFLFVWILHWLCLLSRKGEIMQKDLMEDAR